MECCKHSKASGMVKSCDKEYEQVMGHTLRGITSNIVLKVIYTICNPVDAYYMKDNKHYSLHYCKRKFLGAFSNTYTG